MRHLNLVSVLFAAALLTGCQTSSSGSPWQYQAQSPPAQSAPAPIAGPAAAQTQVAAYEPPPSVQPVEEQLLEEPAAYQAAPAQQQQAAAAPGAKVAILLPLSGPHAPLGNAMLKAAQMALFDIGGGSLELLPRDTKGTAEGGRAAAQSAVNEGAQLILGPVFAEAARAAKSVTSRSNVNMIAFTTDWSVSGDNAFVMGFMPFDQVERVIGYAASKGLRNVGVIAPDSDYGRAVLSAYRNLAPVKGINTVDMAVFSAAGHDVSSVARTFARYDERVNIMQQMGEGAVPPPAPFDAVLMPVGGDTARGLGNMLSQYDLPASAVRRLGTGLWDDATLASEPGLNGGWFAAPSPGGRTAFETRFNGLYKEPPPRLASLAYDATALASVLARTGLQQNGSPAFDRVSIANPNGFSGIDGIFRFRPDGNVERGLAVLEMKNGAVQVIDEAPRTFQQRSSAY